MNSRERYEFIHTITARLQTEDISESEFILAMSHGADVPVRVALVVTVRSLFPNSHFKYN